MFPFSNSAMTNVMLPRVVMCIVRERLTSKIYRLDKSLGEKPIDNVGTLQLFILVIVVYSCRVIVVTGAAGYIGSHVCKELLDIGHSVIAIDNLSTGKHQFLDQRALFYKGNIQNRDFLISTLSKFERGSIKGVIHLAGLKFASESVKNPLSYYETNSSGTQMILSVMQDFDIQNVVFSSSCSVYGDVFAQKPVSESENLKPISPYGKSKLFAESFIQDAVNSLGFRAISLRYFNVAGGTPGVSCDLSRFNIFPNLFRAATDELQFDVYGNQYETQDGTCVRDYVDVRLLANAHIFCLESLLTGRYLDLVYNLGSGVGNSVYEIIRVVSEVTGIEIKAKLKAPRLGDPSQILADVTKAKRDLAWNHSISLEEIVESGWNSWKYFRDRIV